MPVHVRLQPTGGGRACRAVLDTLPTWFGFPETNDDYVATADANPTVVATDAEDGDDVVGILTITRHSPYAAEVHVMGVRADRHRQGVGRQMLRLAERHLACDGVEFLQVKTLSPSRHDEGYERTRAFYEAVGFRPLEEFPTLWNPDNPALQLVKTIRPERDVMVSCVTLDCHDPAGLARFWSEALGWPVRHEEGDGAYVSPPEGGPGLELIGVDDDRAEVGKNRMHVGIRARHLDREVARLTALGATFAWEETFPEGWPERNVVLRDPEGNEFCIGGPREPEANE